MQNTVMLPNIEEIKKRRILLQLTQKQLAVICSMSQSLIAKIESKKVSPSYAYIKKIFENLEALEKKEELKAKDIMNNPVVFVNPNDKTFKAIKIMKEKGFSQLPVVDNGVAVGSVSDKNILELISNGENPKYVYNKSVKDFMEDSFPTVSKETGLNVMAAILKQNFAVLVSDKGKNVGIVTKADLLKSVLKG